MKKLSWHVHDASAFAAHAAEWDALNQRCQGLPFLESLFLQPLLRVFGVGGERLALGYLEGELVAGLILRREGFGRWASFQPSQLPLGPILVGDGMPVPALAKSLLRALPGAALALSLTELDPASQARGDNSEVFNTLDYVPTAWVDVAGSFDDYWAARGKNLRQNMRKQRSKLGTDGATLQLEDLREPADMAAAIQDYGKLETQSWKADIGTAVGGDNPQATLYQQVLEGFAAVQRARVYRYRINADVVAMDLCIASTAGVLVILKTSYDSANKSISPAFLMREEQFAALFAEGRIRRIEFFGKVMEWHTRWTEQQRMLYHCNAYRHALVPRLIGLVKRVPRPAEPAAA